MSLRYQTPIKDMVIRESEINKITRTETDMRILFLTNLLPYPLDNGGKIKSYSTLQSLKKGGHVIDLVCFNESEIIVPEYEKEILKYCNSVNQIYLKLTTADNKIYMLMMALKSIFSKYSFGLFKYKSGKMRNLIKLLISSSEYDLVYYDHLQLFIYNSLIASMRINCIKIIDEHNCEAIIMKRNTDNSKNLMKKLFFLLEYQKLYRFERKSIKSSDKCIVLSVEDYKALYDMCGEFNHEIIPIGMIDKGIKRSEYQDDCIRILFIGTLTWEPNNNGIVWFMKKVVPLIEQQNINVQLYIVGKNPSEELRTVVKKYNNIFITGYVESVEEYYDKCHCMIVPLFIGSGQRVKIIEAFSKGMPVISTTIGAEGLNFEDKCSGLIANTPEEFVSSIMEMRNKKMQEKLSINARKVYEKFYSMEAVQHKILKCITEL